MRKFCVREVLPVLLVFLSGFCALVYQSVWMRALRLMLGASTPSTSVTLAVFMLGLGLGSIIFSRKADAPGRMNPFRRYLILECGVGLLAFVTLPVLDLMRTFLAQPSLLAENGVVLFLLKIFVSICVLLPSTLLMGGSFPLVVAGMGTAFAPLAYGANTLGALVGVLVSAFWAFETWGLKLTMGATVALNLGIFGLAAWLWPHTSVGAPKESSEPSSSSILLPSRTRSLPLVLAFFCGCVFFIMELVWYRALAPLLGGSTYTLSLVLACVLLGIALGSFAFRAWAARGVRVTWGTMGVTWFLSGLFLLLPYLFQDRVTFLSMWVRSLGLYGFGGLSVGWFCVAWAVIGVPAVLSGFQFPQILSWFGQENPGQRAGWVAASNTLGSVVGAVLGGFVLLPFGLQTVWLGVGLVSFLVGALCVYFAFHNAFKQGNKREQKRILRVSGVGAGAVLLCVGLPFIPGWPRWDVNWGGPDAVWRHTGIGAGRASFVVSQDSTEGDYWAWTQRVNWGVAAQKDGLESAVAVLTGNGSALVVNGKVDGHATGDAGTQVMGSMLPALLHPGRPKQGLIIGFGTGSSAGWLTQVPSMEQVTTYEIEQAVIDVASYFKHVNHDVLSQPKFNLKVGDGRWLLLQEKKSFDVIFSAPSNPYRAGLSSFYAKEFYEEVRSRLAPGGLYAQWTQSYEVDAPTVLTIARTIGSVFGAVEIWTTQSGDLVFVCSHEPLTLDARALSQRIKAYPFSDALRYTWRAHSIEQVLAHRLAGPQWVKQLVRGPVPPGDSSRGAAPSSSAFPKGWLNSDDHNTVEYGFARTVGKRLFLDVAELFFAAQDSLDQGLGQSEGVVEARKLAQERTRVFGPQWASALGTLPHVAEEPSLEQILAEIKAHAQVFKEDFTFVSEVEGLSVAGGAQEALSRARAAVTLMRRYPWLPPRLVTWGLGELTHAAQRFNDITSDIVDLLAQEPFAAWVANEERINAAVDILSQGFVTQPSLLSAQTCSKVLLRAAPNGVVLPQHVPFAEACSAALPLGHPWEQGLKDAKVRQGARYPGLAEFLKGP